MLVVGLLFFFDTPLENSDVLPTALKNFRPYFSWTRSQAEWDFIFISFSPFPPPPHLEAEVFLDEKESRERSLVSCVLYKELSFVHVQI